MHDAVSHKTVAEIMYNRAGSEKDNIQLKSLCTKYEEYCEQRNN